MQSQKTSFIKRTGQGARREFQLMHLAVFPFQFEFLKNVDFPIIAYFEKGNQIIGINGDSPILCNSGTKGDKQRLSSEKNIILFHLFSESNVVYKWSLYKRHPSGEEEFLESCAFNLREVVANYILPHRGDQHTLESVLPNDFHEKQLRGKFVKVGIILSFSLMLATDASLIDFSIKQQFCQPAGKRINPDNIIDISNGDIVPKEEETLGEDSFQSASMLSDVLLQNDSKISNPPPSKESPKQANALAGLESVGHQEQLVEEVGESLDLDQLIIEGTEERVVVRPPPNKSDEDLAFGMEGPEDGNAQLKVVESKKLRHSNSRDYSLLKLDSDQGRQAPVEEIDARLGKEELDLIEEEKNSIKETARLPVEPKSGRRGQLLIQTGTGDETRSSVIVEGMSFKRIILILVIVACAFLVAATYRYSFRKGKARPRSK